MSRASAAERARLGELFAGLCAIPSPFGSEQRCRERVEAELRALGLEPERDDAGNVLARRGERPPLLLCAHLDTVVPEAPIEPLLQDGRWRNANAGILGADNKAAVAVALLAAACGGPLELLFTVGEENALQGAKAFDAGRLRAPYGFVLDHASPIGEVIVASPTYYRLDADVRGRAAHAGIRPEQGRSAVLAAARAVAAMPLGRIDEQTTANVGRIDGGSVSTNVVPDACRVEAEVRSLDAARAHALVTELVDHLHDGANATECDVDVTLARLFEGYAVDPAGSRALRAGEAALRACGYEPRRVVSGGGSDANALRPAGFDCINLANGTERNHQPDECVAVSELEAMLDVVLALLEQDGTP